MGIQQNCLKLALILNVFIVVIAIFAVMFFLAYPIDIQDADSGMQKEDFFEDVTHLVEPCQCGIMIGASSQSASKDGGGATISNSGNGRASDISHKIIGGQEAVVNSIPWQVGIEVFKKFPFCGGTIIGPTTILTAAHCVENASPTFVKVIVAEHDITTFNESNSYNVSVRQIMVHPLYDSSRIVYDYAILRTIGLIPFGKTANAACLPDFANISPSKVDSTNLITSGWGKIGKYASSSTVLKTATLKSYSNEDCCKLLNDDYKCHTKSVVMDDSVLCAGSVSQQIGVCFGDSGGPLIYFNGTHHVLVGVTSYVVGSCGSLGVVDGFARVTHQLDWIRQNGDKYVKYCSAQSQDTCLMDEDCSRTNEQCFKGQCQCSYGYIRDSVNGTCISECDKMIEFNSCSGGFFKAPNLGWSKTLAILNGNFALTDWCFCSTQPDSSHYFMVTFDVFKADIGDKMEWFSSYKKMPSKLEKTQEGYYTGGSFTFKIYSNVLQAQWTSSSFNLLFAGVNFTVTALN